MAIFKLFGSDILMGNSAVTQRAPSFKGGKNSDPNHFVEKMEQTNNIPEISNVIFLCENVQLKALATRRLIKSIKKLCFSLTFLFNNTELKTGTKVKVKINAPNKANPKVYANGENIFPSTFWKAKMGNKAEIMISLEKKIAFPNSVPVFLIKLILASRLKAGIPIFCAR